MRTVLHGDDDAVTRLNTQFTLKIRGQRIHFLIETRIVVAQIFEHHKRFVQMLTPCPHHAHHVGRRVFKARVLSITYAESI